MVEHGLWKYDILCIDIHSQLNDITLMIDLEREAGRMAENQEVYDVTIVGGDRSGCLRLFTAACGS